MACTLRLPHSFDLHLFEEQTQIPLSAAASGIGGTNDLNSTTCAPYQQTFQPSMRQQYDGRASATRSNINLLQYPVTTQSSQQAAISRQNLAELVQATPEYSVPNPLQWDRSSSQWSDGSSQHQHQRHYQNQPNSDLRYLRAFMDPGPPSQQSGSSTTVIYNPRHVPAPQYPTERGPRFHHIQYKSNKPRLSLVSGTSPTNGPHHMIHSQSQPGLPQAAIREAQSSAQRRFSAVPPPRHHVALAHPTTMSSEQRLQPHSRIAISGLRKNEHIFSSTAQTPNGRMASRRLIHPPAQQLAHPSPHNRSSMQLHRQDMLHSFPHTTAPLLHAFPDQNAYIQQL